MTTYAQTGVDVDVEEQAAKLLYKAAKATWANRRGHLGEVVTPADDFSSLRAMRVGGLPPGTVASVGFDGVGTKAEFAELSGKYDTLAYDLLAMVCDDAVIRGGEPVVVGSILDVNTLGSNQAKLEAIRNLSDGYVKAAEAANVAIINGELAQLGERVGHSDGFRLNWGAAVLWFANESRLITGQEVSPGDTIVGLAEPGLRSNGISLVRQVLLDAFGDRWPEQDLGGTPLIDLALQPSVLYTKAVVDMFGGWDMDSPARARIHAAAHITGGGLVGKLARALRPSGLGAVVDDPMPAPALMLHCQSLGKVADHEAYRTWHMGQGMVIITPEPHPVLAIARAHHLHAAVIGSVTTDAKIRIASRGFFAERERWLEYNYA